MSSVEKKHPDRASSCAARHTRARRLCPAAHPRRRNGVRIQGEIISEAEVARRYPRNARPEPYIHFRHRTRPQHRRRLQGNIARWINHSCDPNCDTYDKDKRMFIAPSATSGRARNSPTTIASRRRAHHQRGEVALAVLVRAKNCRGTVLVPTPKREEESQAPAGVTAPQLSHLENGSDPHFRRKCVKVQSNGFRM